MFKTFDAMIGSLGEVRVLGAFLIPATRHSPSAEVDGSRQDLACGGPAGRKTDGETALLSQASLAKDWIRPEEDAAWQYLTT